MSNRTGEVDDFLDKVNEIHSQVHGLVSGTVSLEDIDKQQQASDLVTRRKEEDKLRKEREKQDVIRKGSSGKGQGEDYVSFCKFCFVEYSYELPKCVHCGNKTMSKQERRDELKVKVEEYKKNKSSKDERKKKWELWRKTQAIYWKKSSTNYSKWDYFTSSDEEEEAADPILPKNDPNFAALEKDLEDRMKKREQDKKIALQMKAEGNDYLAKRDYLKAIESYTLGMERMKDMKELYTNRALAYLKLGNYELAIKDCSSMLDFIEVFEKGYEQSSALCFKALIRRAQCYKEVNKIDDAIEDTEQALKLSPTDKEALRLKAEFQLAKVQQGKSNMFKDVPKQQAEKKEISEQIQEKSEEQDTKQQEDFKDQNSTDLPSQNDVKSEKQIVDDFLQLQSPSKDDIDKVVNAFKKNSDLKIYANDKNIAKKLSSLVKGGDIDKTVYLLIIVFIQDNPIYIDQFFKNGGPTNLWKRLKEKAEIIQKADDDTKKSEFFAEIEEAFEVFLNITENEKGRVLLRDQMFLNDFLDSFYPLIVSNLRAEKEVASSYFGLITNFAVVSPKFAKYLETKYLDKMMEPLVQNVLNKTKTSKYNRMKENIYGLVANLLREDSVRVYFLTMTPVLETFYKCIIGSLDSFAILNQTNLKWIKSVENIFAIFINLVFGVSDDLRNKFFVQNLQLLEHVRRFLNLSKNRNEYIPVLLRLLQLLSKFDFDESLVKGNKELIIYSFKEHFDQKAKEIGLADNAVRMYARWFSKQNANLIKNHFTSTDIELLISNLIVIIKENNEERFVNATLLAGNIAEVYPECSSKFKECIPILLDVCKDKMGTTRKNAAICVAKLSKDPANIQVIRQLHGIEILSSISKFVLEK